MFQEIARRDHIEALERNMGKEIAFTTNLNEKKKGFINGAHTQGHGNERVFCYEVSKAKNPRTKFSIYKGTWYSVRPIQIDL